jgi:hypothetical protein
MLSTQTYGRPRQTMAEQQVPPRLLLQASQCCPMWLQVESRSPLELHMLVLQQYLLLLGLHRSWAVEPRKSSVVQHM